MLSVPIRKKSQCPESLTHRPSRVCAFNNPGKEMNGCASFAGGRHGAQLKVLEELGVDRVREPYPLGAEGKHSSPRNNPPLNLQPHCPYSRNTQHSRATWTPRRYPRTGSSHHCLTQGSRNLCARAQPSLCISEAAHSTPWDHSQLSGGPGAVLWLGELLSTWSRVCCTKENLWFR